MIPLGMIMSSKEELVKKISKILKADEDLGFLAKLAPKELVLLASHLKDSLDPKSAR